MAHISRVSLLVTCLVDQFFPEVGESVVRVLQRLGIQVDFPQAQTCCGQPMFNAGFHQEAGRLARRLLDIFDGSEYLVAPSGSCGSMVKIFGPGLFRDEPELHRRAQELAGRTYEFSQFLVDVVGVTDVGATYSGKVTYHASCHLLRELGVRDAPLALLKAVQGVEYVPMTQYDTCCGFGGSFAVKYPHISTALLDDKLRWLQESGADTLVANDTGCLMHLQGALHRRGLPVKVMHLAELLAQERKA